METRIHYSFYKVDVNQESSRDTVFPSVKNCGQYENLPADKTYAGQPVA